MLVPGRGASPGFGCRLWGFRCFIRGSFALISLIHTWRDLSATPFNHNVHHRGLWTAAAYGSLKPPPTRRLRRAYLHLSYSMTLSRLLDTTSHRSVLDCLQAHGSCHPVKVATFRPNRSVPPVSSWPYWLGRGWPVPFAPRELPRFFTTLGQSDPETPHSYTRPRGCFHLWLLR